MDTRQKPNNAVIERELWKYSSTPRISIVKQLLNKLLVELETVNESEKVSFGENFNLYEQIKNFEIDMIRYALYLTNNNQSRAARMLGIKNTALNMKIKRYGIES